MKKDIPRVSIIILSYNSMQYIYEAIQSVLIQTYDNIELVVADDASSEFDEHGIEKYIAERKSNITSCIVYQNEKNLGTVKNINTAIKKSTGEIIVNLASDDLLFDKSVIEKIVKKFQDTDCNCLATRRALFFSDIKKIEGYIPNDYEIHSIMQYKSMRKEYLSFFCKSFYNFASGSALSYRRDFIEKIGYYDEQYRLFEDGPFLTKCILNKYKIEKAYDIISVYYRSGGVSTTAPSRAYKEDLSLFYMNALKDKYITGYYRRVLKQKIYICKKEKRKDWRDVIKYIDVELYWFLVRLCNAIKKIAWETRR